MPFKNNEDKKAWRRAYRVKNRERCAAWSVKYYNSERNVLKRSKHYNGAVQVSKRNKRRHIQETRTRQREIKSDASCLNAVMRKLRHDIMVRDGVGLCSICKKIKPKSQMLVKQYPRTWCRVCANKKQVAFNLIHPEIRKAWAKRSCLKIKGDPIRHLRKCIRTRLCKFMKRSASGVKVRGSKLQYLGCSANDACIYIEQQFKKGMTWDNHGMKGWHVDHVIPLAAFDLRDEGQMRKAFHYTNLQPLWAYDNLVKNDKILNPVHQPMLILGPAMGPTGTMR